MKISVIIASYNYAKYLELAIQSVIDQTYTDWELIVVDDGSSDNSIEIIKNFIAYDSRIKLYQHENGMNKGLAKTLQLGLSKASGDWIAFLESDDYLSKDNLQKKLEIINKYPEVKLIFNKVKILDETTSSQKQNKKLKRFNNTQNFLAKTKFPTNLFKDFFLNNLILTFSCVMINAKTLRDESFNTPVDSMLDWWLWIHLAYNNQFYFINEELTTWRLHPKSYIEQSTKPLFKPVQAKAYLDIYKQLGKPLSLGLFIATSYIKLMISKLLRRF